MDQYLGPLEHAQHVRRIHLGQYERYSLGHESDQRRWFAPRDRWNSETAFSTSFLANATPYEAQGTPGDSGGGVFAKDPTTGVWTLAGTMFSVSTLPGQPWGISVFGDTTFSADLSIYRNEIYQTMGVPSIVNGQFIATVASEWSQPNSGVNGQYIAWAASHWMDGAPSGTATAAVPEPSALLLAAPAALRYWYADRRLATSPGSSHWLLSGASSGRCCSMHGSYSGP